jgi:rubrerythrin
MRGGLFEPMSQKKNPVERMLNVALATSLNQYQFYQDASSTVETEEMKELLLFLAKSEEAIIDKIESMMFRGISDAVEEARTADVEEPDETPFDLMRAEVDPRLFVCNKALKIAMNAYTFYLSIAARAHSPVISRLFQYLVHTKGEQIKMIRSVCESF